MPTANIIAECSQGDNGTAFGKQPWFLPEFMQHFFMVAEHTSESKTNAANPGKEAKRFGTRDQIGCAPF